MTVDPPPEVALLWGTRDRPRPGPKPSMSVEAIVTVAIACADAEGLATLSMQRIADELGYTKMSLYRYVPGKAELVALMLDTALGPPPDLADAGDGWRPKLRAWALHLWTAGNRHPWWLEAAIGPRVLGPNEMGWLESGLGALVDTGLPYGERLDTIVLLTSHVRGLIQQTAGAPRPEHDLRAAIASVLSEHGDRYPEVVAALGGSGSGSSDEALEFGIDRILDGLAAHLGT
ncbi:TetR family transcriptional regulator [Herbihabitans rhizosphaerae]|uniref:TetR family transcriptional regulator n=1 Tax=Herbihabitans rhizosphaerae TaxID=1872711 RepID=A0A4Q7KM42_9PSEU|nr:TetR/AcrR family transcriptional regulator [Herbihabitans rhizosphaerae]RZS37738.1 TetR family transcriptional regulator [Herbihabitans rhizosphaerae]